METKGININSTFDNYHRYKEGSFGLRFTTNLICNEDEVIVFNRLVGQSGSLLFVSEGQEQEDIPEIKTDDLTTKTPAQRLRNVLYRVWEQSGSGEFRDFYEKEMNKIIDYFRKKLD